MGIEKLNLIKLPRFRTKPHPKSTPHGLETGYVNADDGTKVYFEDTGGDGEPLFFLYGLGCAITHWKYQLQYFSESRQDRIARRVIWIDYRGHGSSDFIPKDGRLDFDTVLRDIAAVARARKVTSATFIGHSLGGTLGLALAERHPELVNGLVMLGAPVKPMSHQFTFPMSKFAWQTMIDLNQSIRPAIRHLHKIIPVIRLPLREIVRTAGFNRDLTKVEDIEEYLTKLCDVNPNEFWDLAGDLEKFDASSIAAKVKCPTLILAGANDKLVPVADFRWLSGLLPTSEFEVLERGSHCPQLDEPQAVNFRIEMFLRDHRI